MAARAAILLKNYPVIKPKRTCGRSSRMNAACSWHLAETVPTVAFQPASGPGPLAPPLAQIQAFYASSPYGAGASSYQNKSN